MLRWLRNVACFDAPIRVRGSMRWRLVGRLGGQPPAAGASKEVAIDVTEGMWPNFDVSPDGKTIAFDLLGDIYVPPIGGGEAHVITEGVAWDMQPRFSPSSKRIAFTSDRGAAFACHCGGIRGQAARRVTLPSQAARGAPSGWLICMICDSIAHGLTR